VPLYLPPPAGNPLVRLLAALVAAFMLGLAFFFGLIVLAVVAGLILLAWLLLTVRVWWLRRRGSLPPDFQAEPAEHKTSGPGQVLEGDYEVVSRNDDEDASNPARD
jgi:hypothetical protein